MPVGLGDVLGAVKTVYDQFQKAAGNSEACQAMLTRLTIIEAISGELKAKAIESKPCQAALKELMNCNKEAAVLAGKFSDTGKIVALLKAGTYEADFVKLNERLNHVIAGLNLALNVRTQEKLDTLLGEAELTDKRQVALMGQMLGSQDRFMEALLKQQEQEAKAGISVKGVAGDATAEAKAFFSIKAALTNVQAGKDLKEETDQLLRVLDNIAGKRVEVVGVGGDAVAKAGSSMYIEASLMGRKNIMEENLKLLKGLKDLDPTSPGVETGIKKLVAQMFPEVPEPVDSAAFLSTTTPVSSSSAELPMSDSSSSIPDGGPAASPK